MSAKILKLLAETSQETAGPSSTVLGTLRHADSVGAGFSSAPPGLEPATATHSSKLVERAESSSLCSTYVDDSEFASLPADQRSWGQAAYTDVGDGEAFAWGGVRNMILSTTPLTSSLALDCSLSSAAGASWLADTAWPPATFAPAVGLGYAGGLDCLASSEGLMQVSAAMQQPSNASTVTAGSAAHEDGTCKPCAFVYTKGCQSGMPRPQHV